MKAFTAYTAGCFSPNGTSIQEDGTIRHKQNLTYLNWLRRKRGLFGRLAEIECRDANPTLVQTFIMSSWAQRSHCMLATKMSNLRCWKPMEVCKVLFQICQHHLPQESLHGLHPGNPWHD